MAGSAIRDSHREDCHKVQDPYSLRCMPQIHGATRDVLAWARSVIEREIMGMDHQQLGAALCEHWKFPRSCQLDAGYHHKPTSLGDQNRVLVTLVSWSSLSVVLLTAAFVSASVITVGG